MVSASRYLLGMIYFYLPWIRSLNSANHSENQGTICSNLMPIITSDKRTSAPLASESPRAQDLRFLGEVAPVIIFIKDVNMRTQNTTCTNFVSLAVRLGLHFSRPIMDLSSSLLPLSWRDEAVDGHDVWAWIYPQMSPSKLSPWWMGPLIWPAT
jgi:hypothetical protein